MAQAPPCPYCGASSYQLREKRWLLCKACGQEFDLQRDLCPVCKHLNQAGAQACGNCGAALREDKVDRLITERSKGLLDWREERTRIGVAQKKEEEEASRRRMEAYWADDRARREAAARARAKQREKEKRALIAVSKDTSPAAREKLPLRTLSLVAAASRDDSDLQRPGTGRPAVASMMMPHHLKFQYLEMAIHTGMWFEFARPIQCNYYHHYHKLSLL